MERGGRGIKERERRERREGKKKKKGKFKSLLPHTHLKTRTGAGGKTMGAYTEATAKSPGCRKRSNLCLVPGPACEKMGPARNSRAPMLNTSSSLDLEGGGWGGGRESRERERERDRDRERREREGEEDKRERKKERRRGREGGGRKV